MNQAPLNRIQALSPTPYAQNSPKEISDWVLLALRSAGIKDYFGIPGGAIEPLLNAIARSEFDDVNLVTCKHEGSAGFMADGFYKESGKIAACFATTGPGATNLLTGVASAYVDAVPLIVFTGQSGTKNFGKGALQDSSCAGVDMVGMFKHCTHYSTLVSDADQLPQKLSKALNILHSDNPGPVHLSIPVNILRAENSINLDANLLANNILLSASQISESLSNIAVQDLKSAKERVTVLIGERANNIADSIVKLCDLKNWKIVTTPRSKGLVSGDFRNNCGVVGLGGHKSARDALSAEQADLILVIGATLDECSTANWDINGVYSSRVIHVDSNPTRLDYFSLARYKFHCDLKRFFDYLESNLTPKLTPVEATPSETSEPPEKEARDLSYSKNIGETLKDLRPLASPKFFMEYLCRSVPKNTRIYSDSGSAYLWAIHHWNCHQPEPGKNPFQIGLGFSSMGWAIGASLGAAIGNGNNDGVICLTGDGSTLMHTGELATAVQYDLNILYIILNDSGYGMVKHGQRIAGAEQIGYELPPINFAQVGEEMGIHSYRVDSYNDLFKIDFSTLLSKTGPVLLDLYIDADETPPIMDRMSALGTGGEDE